MKSTPFIFVLALLGFSTRNEAALLRPKPETKAYAIGFDLTPSYGTISIQLSEDRIVSLGRVNGSDEYIAMMARLALPSSRHMAAPYEWWHDGGALAGVGDIPRVQLREFRKSVGLPASHDAGILGKMFDALKTTAKTSFASLVQQEQLSDPTDLTISSIVVSSPELNALYDEEVIEAAQFSGLQLLSSEWYARQPKHANAYWNAYGLDFYSSGFPTPRGCAVMFVSLTRSGLEIAQKVRRTNRTCQLEWAQQFTWFSSDLGASLDLGEDEAQSRNWTARVKELVASCYGSRHHNKYVYGVNTSDVLFAGESGANPILQRTILEAVVDSQPDAPDVVVWPRLQRTLDPDNALVEEVPAARPELHSTQMLTEMEYGGSRGAASMAWDMLYGSLPKNVSLKECWNEQHAEDADHIPPYGVTFWNYLAELPADGGWAVWKKACCLLAPVCPLPECLPKFGRRWI